MDKIFNKILIGIFYFGAYIWYYKKYRLPKNFRFNGYLIRLSGSGKIEVGQNSYISFYSYINVHEGTKVTVGSNVSIGHNVKIYTSQIDTKKFILENEKVNIYGNVIIGDNTLIGSNVFITPGVTIGKNVVIGANSLVTKDIPDYCVAGGVPAKILKSYAV